MSIDPHPVPAASSPPGRPTLGRTRRPATDSAAPANLWDIGDVAAFLGVTKQTIYSWRTTGYGPAGFRVGKHLRWRPSTVVAWTIRLEERQ
jgi:predicted DNA-binding transcriptional regulator AlpA